MLVVDPAHAEALAEAIRDAGMRSRGGESVVVFPGPPGSGVVGVALRDLGGEARTVAHAFGSMS